MDKSKIIFGNEMSASDYKKALKTKNKYIKKFGDDLAVKYHLKAVENNTIGKFIGVKNLVLSDTPLEIPKENSIVIGNIRMGFGHYRISMAIASAASSMGITPYWFDLNSFPETTCTKVISHQNELYSLGSRLSQKSRLFNKLYWEPLNSEGFRRLSYNCSDQKAAELMTPLFGDLPKDIPYAATHVWPSQAAVHAGLTSVVNVIPDNWPMALHLSEGAIHTVQTHSAFLGYKALRGMDKKRDLLPMPDDSLFYTGHYIDHELVQNIDADCRRREKRLSENSEKRYLLTIGGAGAQQSIFVSIIRKLLPYIKEEKAALMINLGDHRKVFDELVAAVPELSAATKHFDCFEETAGFAQQALDRTISGVHVFCHNDIFAAVYSTNLLMRACDVLITKPSELAFYPVPKLMIKRVGGHEAWGAIHSAELGDGTYECETSAEILSMLELIQNNDSLIYEMCKSIRAADKAEIYSGAYKAVRLATGERID